MSRLLQPIYDQKDSRGFSGLMLELLEGWCACDFFEQYNPPYQTKLGGG